MKGHALPGGNKALPAQTANQSQASQHKQCDAQVRADPANISHQRQLGRAQREPHQYKTGRSDPFNPWRHATPPTQQTQASGAQHKVYPQERDQISEGRQHD
jgi:hypothetical protein